MKEQVLESPFCKKEFLELVDIVSEVKTTKFADYAISDSSIVNIGDRDFVDYRPDISIAVSYTHLTLPTICSV